jgi:5'-deoxynucleotidase YfbR-like HD superfamily hydrolase
MKRDKFTDFLKIVKLYELKKIPRVSSNHYFDEKDNISYKRRETTAEHVYSCLRLADFFLSSETEFSDLDKVKVYELLMYHDDIEIITLDTGIADRQKRKNKKDKELEAIPILYNQIPTTLNDKFISLDTEHRNKSTLESKFSNGIDKMDSLVHEFQYPYDWGPEKNFTEKTVREWFQPNFEYSPTFMKYFEKVIKQLDSQGYFNKNSSIKKLLN